METRDRLQDEIEDMENPFTDEYVKKEVEWYGLKEYDKDGIVIKTRQLMGRCDDFLNKNFRVGDIEAPTFFVDKKLWMSLTPMEIQSAYLAILFASGDCATAGLGMGYIVLKWAENDKVDSIDVYEIEDRVITFFKDTFSDRPGFNKINFIHGDVRELMKDKDYDFVFMDPYDQLLDTKIESDFKLFAGTCNIGDYHFWGQEKVLLAAILEFEKYICLGPFEKQYFRMWEESEPSNMYQSIQDEDSITELLELMGK